MRILILVLFVMFSCTHKPVQNKIDESQLSELAKKKLDEARELLKSNNTKQGLAKLAELHDKNLIPLEKALKYNLKGVMLFSIDEIPKSLLNFEIAEKYSPKETQLYSQVQLNMASGHYKLNQLQQLRDRFALIDPRQSTDAEVKKLAQLQHAYGVKAEDHWMIVNSSIILLSDAKTLIEVQTSPLYAKLKDSYAKLALSQRSQLLEEFRKSKNLAMAQLAQVEADERYNSGDRKGSDGVVAWLKTEYQGNEEVEKYIRDYELRLSSSSRISSADIGVVLPLTGEKASFGQKALSGIDTGLKVLGLKDNVKIHTKDSADNAALAGQSVTQLIRENNVSFIIGGLFPESAKLEYLEARKHGVLFISLSQINLPHEEKDHNLIEVQGSIESQVETLLSDEMIRKFGSRIGVLFPDTEGGKAYIKELWRKSTQKNLQITSVASYPKNTHDYRDTAQLFLALKYPRERAEENRIVDDVYSYEKSSIRRVQTLPPVLDFDWVFLASYPHEATQLIPTLGYYDANRLKVIGGPSWSSKSMVKEQKNLGTLYFVGDDPNDLNQGVLNKFQEIYGNRAGLIEIIALDAMKIGAEALRITGEVGSRDEFVSKLKTNGKVQGLTTDWELKEGVWLKRMNPMVITRGQISKLSSGENH